jgi:hypothetical protein
LNAAGAAPPAGRAEERAIRLRIGPLTVSPMGVILSTQDASRENREPAMDDVTQTALEAAVFRRLVAHLRKRTDVQNIDMMIVAGFCRNCLGDWYREAAAERGIALEKDAARERVYGMAPAEWKKRYQKDATPEQQAEFERAQQSHSHD